MKEARQGRLHPDESVENHLTAIDSGKALGSGRRREDIVRGGDLRAVASQPLWGEEAEVC